MLPLILSRAALLPALLMLGSCASSSARPPLQAKPGEPASNERSAAPTSNGSAPAGAAPKQDPGAAVAANPASSDGSQAGEGAPVALPAGTTVLHIGDSFAGALGLDLNRELKAAGVRGVLKYQTSSYIPTWASGKEIELHLANYNPDLVLITLGANELEIPDPQERVRTIRKLVSRLGQRPCVWIGPPLWRGARPALLEVIRAECAPCVYLDSTAYLPSLARARDGIHPSGAARTEWASLVMRWLSERRDPKGAQPWSLRAAQ